MKNLVDVFQFGISAVKFFGQLVPLLLIPLPGSLVVWTNTMGCDFFKYELGVRFTFQTLKPVKSLAVGLLPEITSALHLPAQELRTLRLLGECCPLVQDCLEHLPLLVQLVDHL